MGLAASQARLLSITQRMSDNELRAQLINNQKMRLSSESSQVSENYINALNKTNLMFSNYDANDNAQTVDLTFNNLTAFNQYNNQYGLTNTAGNILISETEAEYYALCRGKADPEAEFLKLHHIEYTTSYWDTLENQMKSCESYYSSPNGDGVVTTEDGTYQFYSATQMKDMYEGNNGYESYANTVKTKEYTDFAGYYDKFAEKLTEIEQASAGLTTVKTKLAKAILQNVVGSATSYANYLDASSTSSQITGLANTIAGEFSSGADATNIANTLASNLTSDKFAETAFGTGNYKKTGTGTSAKYYQLTSTGGSYNKTSGATTVTQLTDQYTLIRSGNAVSGYTYTLERPTNDGTSTVSLPATVTEGTNALGNTLRVQTSDGIDETFLITNISGTTGNQTANAYLQVPDDRLNPTTYTLEDGSTYQSMGLIGQYIQQCIIDIINDLINNNATINTSGTACSTLTSDEIAILQNNTADSSGLSDAKNGLMLCLFGVDDGTNTGTKVLPTGMNYSDYTAEELALILDYLTSGTVTWKTSGTDSVGKVKDETTGEYRDVFLDWSKLQLPQDVFNAFALDTMMDLFGEPVYTYLYTNGEGTVNSNLSNTDATAEAKWLKNLFAKIESSGYQVLANGLASSTDWLQFALENGIVIMEQVNDSEDWVGITYTSCSDISEQSDSLAVTLAEAEYNKAMRQIEAKDEMFDLELKNIDTEHSSLESEYESVKKAMSGNIERNFQMYS